MRGVPGGVPVTTITIDLTAHPRRFHTVPSPAVAFLHLHASGSLRTASPKCAVDRIAVCSPIIDNGVCNIASVAVPSSLPCFTAYTTPLYLVYRHRLHSRHRYQVDLCLWSR